MPAVNTHTHTHTHSLQHHHQPLASTLQCDVLTTWSPALCLHTHKKKTRCPPSHHTPAFYHYACIGLMGDGGLSRGVGVPRGKRGASAIWFVCVGGGGVSWDEDGLWGAAVSRWLFELVKGSDIDCPSGWPPAQRHNRGRGEGLPFYSPDLGEAMWEDLFKKYHAGSD